VASSFGIEIHSRFDSKRWLPGRGEIRVAPLRSRCFDRESHEPLATHDHHLAFRALPSPSRAPGPIKADADVPGSGQPIGASYGAGRTAAAKRKIRSDPSESLRSGPLRYLAHAKPHRTRWRGELGSANSLSFTLNWNANHRANFPFFWVRTELVRKS